MISYTFIGEGDFYGIGANYSGQLANKNISNPLPVTKIDFFCKKEIQKFKASNASSYVLLKNGGMYAFGHNLYGQLGINSKEDQRDPVLISFFKDNLVKDFTSGFYHNIVLTGIDLLF